MDIGRVVRFESNPSLYYHSVVLYKNVKYDEKLIWVRWVGNDVGVDEFCELILWLYKGLERIYVVEGSMSRVENKVVWVHV